MQEHIVKVTSPAPRDIWQEIADTDKKAFIYHMPIWTDVMCSVENYEDVSRLYETQDGRKFILPLVKRKYLPGFLSLQTGFPVFWGFGGLTSCDELYPEDFAAVHDDLSRRGALQISVLPDALQADKWAVTNARHKGQIPRCAHVLELDSDFETVWKNRFTGGTRTGVRKAEKSGLVVECDTTGKLIPVYYDLLLQSLKRWARKQNEPEWLYRLRLTGTIALHKIEAWAKLLGDRCRTWVAWYDNTPVAAIIILQATNAYYALGAMNKELANLTRANNLLHKLAIEDACRAGCHYYNMGLTGDVSGSLAVFKSHFGAQAYEFNEYHFETIPLTRLRQSFRGAVKSIVQLITRFK